MELDLLLETEDNSRKIDFGGSIQPVDGDSVVGTSYRRPSDRAATSQTKRTHDIRDYVL